MNICLKVEKSTSSSSDPASNEEHNALRLSATWIQLFSHQNFLLSAGEMFSVDMKNISSGYEQAGTSGFTLVWFSHVEIYCTAAVLVPCRTSAHWHYVCCWGFCTKSDNLSNLLDGIELKLTFNNIWPDSDSGATADFCTDMLM